MVAEMTTWGERTHAQGKAPSVERQVEWLAGRVGHRLPVEEIVHGLDRVLHAADVRDAPGARAALRALRRRGVPIGLVSTIMFESSGATRALLERHHLIPELDVLVLSCEGAHSKPGAEPFAEALRALHALPSECVHVGDDRYDVEGASAALVRPILYTGLARHRPGPPLRLSEREVRSTPILPRWARLGPVLASVG